MNSEFYIDARKQNCLEIFEELHQLGLADKNLFGFKRRGYFNYSSQIVFDFGDDLDFSIVL